MKVIVHAPHVMMIFQGDDSVKFLELPHATVEEYLRPMGDWDRDVKGYRFCTVKTFDE